MPNDDIAALSPLTNVGEIDRSTYIGGSDVAAIMGLGAYGATPLTVYLKKIGEYPDEMDAKQKLFLERRKRFEEPIVQMLREEFDGKIVGTNRRYVDPEFPFFAAEIDWEWVDQDGAIQNGETKTVSPFAFGEIHGWGEAGTSDYPVHYVAQNMWGLGITSRRSCILAAMAGFDGMVFYRVERDDEVISEMRARCRDFWINHVLARIPPDPISLADVMRMTLRMRGRPVEADEEMLKNLQNLATVRGNLAALDGDKDELMFKIGAAILKQWGIPDPALKKPGVIDPAQTGPDNALILQGGQQIASWALQSTTRIQTKELREAEPEIAAKFSKKTPSRVLRFKKPK